MTRRTCHRVATAVSVLLAALALEVDSPWLRAGGSYAVDRAHGRPVLVVTLPPRYPIPPAGVLMRDALTAAACAAVAAEPSLSLPLPVILRVGGQVKGAAVVTRCEGA